eukprot:764132-Hanusia_phi.AAC.2
METEGWRIRSGDSAPAGPAPASLRARTEYDLSASPAGGFPYSNLKRICLLQAEVRLQVGFGVGISGHRNSTEALGMPGPGVMRPPRRMPHESEWVWHSQQPGVPELPAGVTHPGPAHRAESLGPSRPGAGRPPRESDCRAPAANLKALITEFRSLVTRLPWLHR